MNYHRVKLISKSIWFVSFVPKKENCLGDFYTYHDDKIATEIKYPKILLNNAGTSPYGIYQHNKSTEKIYVIILEKSHEGILSSTLLLHSLNHMIKI